MEFSFALFLLMDLVLGAQPYSGMHPNTLLRGTDEGSRGAVQRQQVSRLPLYMMQLYRTMLTEDRERTAAPSVSRSRPEDNPALHHSDSVISLVAKSECCTLQFLDDLVLKHCSFSSSSQLEFISLLGLVVTGTFVVFMLKCWLWLMYFTIRYIILKITQNHILKIHPTITFPIKEPATQKSLVLEWSAPLIMNPIKLSLMNVLETRWVMTF